jgi:hypothetical protein
MENVTQAHPAPSGAPPVPAAQLPVPKPQTPLAISSVIGKLDLRTPEEDLEFQRCEKIISGCWTHFVEFGDAFATICDNGLYKNDYPTAELYCRGRWGLGMAQVRRYIAAAKVYHTLATLQSVPLPECEAHVRPLVGLPEELAQKAWLQALSKAPGGQVTGLVVKRAVKWVLKTEQPAALPQSSIVRQQRYRWRESVRSGFKELITLLFGNADREVLIAKVQEIQRLLDPLLNPKRHRP